MITVNVHRLHTVLFTITLPSVLSVLFTYASFLQCDIFSQLLPIWLYNNVYSISVTYSYSTVCNCSPQYTDCGVYICFPFHNVNILPQLLYNCLYENVYIESSLFYMLYCLQLHYPVYWLCCLHMLSFSQCDIFSQLLPNWLYNNVYSISSTYT